MDSIIKKNVTLMRNRKEGGMQYLLSNESIGGNAGSWEGFPCAGASFHFDSFSGEIKYFGNWQNVPQKMREEFSQACFLIAIDLRGGLDHIVKFIYEGSLAETTRHIMHASLAEYNKICGFD